MILLTTLCAGHNVAIQWIPAHCGILGNETADTLAREGSLQEQWDSKLNFKEAKTIIKAQQQKKWLEQHPNYIKNDPLHALTRAEQVIIFRLRTGHNRLNSHMYKKFKIGTSEMCPCNEDIMTAEHLLQSCQSHRLMRNQTWPNDVTIQTKLYGNLEDLQRTATFIKGTYVSI